LFGNKLNMIKPTTNIEPPNAGKKISIEERRNILKDYQNLLSQNKIKKEIINDNNKYNWNKKNNKKLFSSIIVIFLIIISTFVYQRFALSEETARETSNRFFNMLIMKNSNEDEIKKLYPDFDLIGYRIKFDNICTINNISRNSDGDYEVFATY